MNHRLQKRRPDQFRVFVVIDEIYAQKAIVEYVHQAGYRVSGFGDVKEAIRAFAQESAHMVIADLTRPQLQAEKLVAALKRHNARLAAVGVVQKLPTVEAQAADGFEAYLVKPISRDQVRDQLQELLLTAPQEVRPAIVVIDDDADALTAVEHTLERRGFDVHTSTDIGETLKRLKAEPPDLVILDINMPGISGIQVCRQLKSTPETQKVPILIFTSDPSRDNVRKAIDAGADGFVAKPFDPRSLTAKVRGVIGLDTD